MVIGVEYIHVIEGLSHGSHGQKDIALVPQLLLVEATIAPLFPLGDDIVTVFD
ncbi:hypothetical protein [Pedobacter alpinus]|uniref:Uncharacterized protein n=1 Tax=Pedobacter alpinus TaxID=1590643 RepID=A0ABW5TV45_9SPHI